MSIQLETNISHWLAYSFQKGFFFFKPTLIKKNCQYPQGLCIQVPTETTLSISKRWNHIRFLFIFFLFKILKQNGVNIQRLLVNGMKVLEFSWNQYTCNFDKKSQKYDDSKCTVKAPTHVTALIHKKLAPDVVTYLDHVKKRLALGFEYNFWFNVINIFSIKRQKFTPINRIVDYSLQHLTCQKLIIIWTN